MKNSLRWLISINHGSLLNTFRLRKSAKEYAVCSYLEYRYGMQGFFFLNVITPQRAGKRRRRIITIKSSFFFPHQAPTKTAFSSLASLPPCKLLSNLKTQNLLCLPSWDRFNSSQLRNYRTGQYQRLVSDRTEPDMSFELFEPDKSPVQLNPDF